MMLPGLFWAWLFCADNPTGNTSAAHKLREKISEVTFFFITSPFGSFCRCLPMANVTAVIYSGGSKASRAFRMFPGILST